MADETTALSVPGTDCFKRAADGVNDALHALQAQVHRPGQGAADHSRLRSYIAALEELRACLADEIDSIALDGGRHVGQEAQVCG